MAKNIYITERSLHGLRKDNLLEPFIYKPLKEHETSLGDNAAFPKTSSHPFDYLVIKERYNQVIDAVRNEYGYGDASDDELKSELSKLINQAKIEEEPIKDMLERMCENNGIEMFGIPKESINLECKLVDKVKIEKGVRLMPEDDDEIGYDFEDVKDIELANAEVAKRRFVNALVQGASYHYSSLHAMQKELAEINPNLVKLYNHIIWLNEYLLFRTKPKMSDEQPMQGSYVQTHLGSDGNRTSIKAQGIIFPLLQREVVRGLFELFAAHGLPQDRSRAMYVIRKADFLLAEPWDMRFGPELWRLMFGDIKVKDARLIPYVFTKYVGLETEDFNKASQELLSNTQAGNEIRHRLMSSAEHDVDFQGFTDIMQLKNLSKSIIQDEYLSSTDLDCEGLTEEADDGYNYNGDLFNADLDEDMANFYSTLASHATVDNIDFIESDEPINYTNCEQLIVTIDGVIVPKQAVDLFAQTVSIRFQDGGKRNLVQPHLFIHDALQQKGLGTKILAKMVYEFGSVYCGKGRMLNERDVPKMFEKLAQMPYIYVYKDNMCIIAMLTQ